MKRVLKFLRKCFWKWAKPKGFMGYTSDGKAIVLYDDSNTTRLSSYIDRVLEALGHPEAMVTDGSSISDFMYERYTLDEPIVSSTGRVCTEGFRPIDPSDTRLQEVADALGLDKIGPNEYIWQIAQRVKDQET